MTNVSATMTEATKVREAYRKIGMLSETNRIKFKIPVYKNMPSQKCSIPGSEQIVTQDVQIKQDSVVVRTGKGNTYSELCKLNKGNKILRIELDVKADSAGKYWDKVVLSDGRKGYVSREYLEAISLQSNANESYIVTANTNFRNGPGIDGTIIIRTISVDQLVTVVEKGKYKSLNNEEWYRVKLSDGTYGYVGTGFIAPVNAEKVKVVCSDGLNIREQPSSSSSVLKAVAQGTILTRIEKNVTSSDTKYIWDKVTSSSGIVGYVVRQDPSTKKAWIEPLNNTNTGETSGNSSGSASGQTNSEKPLVSGDGYKLLSSNLICKPEMTVEQLKQALTEVTIQDATKANKTTGNLATGWLITYKEKTYTVVVLGDINGDGKVTTVDAARSLKCAANKYELKGAYLDASDVNGDGKVTTVDAARILKVAAGKYKISI